MYVGGVTAYSTLGWFKDPLLSTFLRYSETRLAALLFHELAHQVLYIKDDTAFNESFATAVEEFGIERWLATNGKGHDMPRYHERKELHRTFIDLVSEARRDLRDYYNREIGAEEMRRLKAQRLERLSADVSAALKAAGRDDNHWLSDELNNARLLPMTLYEERVPAFRKLYADCDADLECFYRQAVTISELDEMERNTRLDALSQTISSGS